MATSPCTSGRRLLRKLPSGCVVPSLRLDDPEPRFAAVRLCSDLPLAARDFASEDGSWVLTLPAARLERLGDQLELLDRDGSVEVVCDTGNPRRVPGPFGDKSVVVGAAYRPPAWLDAQGLAGTVDHVGIRVLGRKLDVRVWSPGDGVLPLLVAHDGPEYDELSSLTRYAGAMIAAGALPPFRVGLLPPGSRDEWYSASAWYGRALCCQIVPALREHVAVTGG